MEADVPLDRDLRQRRSAVRKREQQRDDARHRLQAAGKEVYEAFQARGYSYERIARGLDIAVSATTLRKLTSDGDRSGWRPLSGEIYASLDRLTRRVLGQRWNLVGLREALDEATKELKAAKQRLSEAAAEADGLAPAFDLGVLFIPGRAEHDAAAALQQLGDTLTGVFAKGEGSHDPAVEVAEAKLTADDEGPARLVLQRSHSIRDGAEVGGTRTPPRWLVVASPAEHGLGDQDLPAFLRWLFWVLPWLVADHLDGRMLLARSLPGTRGARWVRTAMLWTSAPLIVLLLVLVEVTLLLLMVAVRVPGPRVLGRVAARPLLSTFGLTYTHVRSPATFDANVRRAAHVHDWLRQRCHRVAVVTHRQGAPIGQALVCHGRVDTVGLLLTAGWSPAKVRLFRGLEHTEDPGDALISLLVWLFWATACLGIAYSPFTGGAARLLVTGTEIGLAVFMLGYVTGALALLTWFAHYKHRDLHGALLQLRGKTAEAASADSGQMAWVDLAAAADALTENPRTAAGNPGHRTHAPVTYQGSTWSDHRAYLHPQSEAPYRVVTELARLAPAPAALPDATHLAREADRLRWRVGWLVAARRLSVACGLVGGWLLVLHVPALQTDPVLGLAGAWALTSGILYAGLKGLWSYWNGAAWRLGAARPVGQPDTQTRFALFLVVMSAAVGATLLGVTGRLELLTRVAFEAVASINGAATQVVLVLGGLSFVLVVASVALGSLLSVPAVRRWLERRQIRPDAVVAAGTLLKRLSVDGGAVINGARYRVTRVGWEVSFHRLLRRNRPFRCPDSALMLLRDDAVLLDLREGWVDGKEVAHVRGRRLYYVEVTEAAARPTPRLAGVRDWRAFRRDLPALLRL